MKNWKDIVVSPQTNIWTAIETINKYGVQMVYVLSDSGKLVGTVSDGDIRRGILARVDFENPVTQIMNPSPISMPVNTPQKEIVLMMKQKSIRGVPLVDEHGIVQGEFSIRDLLNFPHHENWVVIMAGGLGKRLLPLTESRPKPMLPIQGKPILETILNNFIEQGFTRFFFAVNYKADIIKEYFGDGKSWNVQIQYLHEKNPLGTAGALSLIPKEMSSPLIVINGDLLTKVNFQNMLEFHSDNQGIATMGVREYDFQVPYGVVQVERHHVTSIKEKPIHRFFVNAGIYVLDQKCLSFIPSNQFYDMTTLFDQLIQEGHSVCSFPIREYWLDVGQFEDFEQAQTEFNQIFTN